MIVREILRKPELINFFDYFNDTDDTVRFLRSCQTPEADAIAEQLTINQKKWLKEWAAESKARIAAKQAQEKIAQEKRETFEKRLSHTETPLRTRIAEIKSQFKKS